MEKIKKMGTRGLTVIFDDKGDLKCSQYGQMDHYPSCAGVFLIDNLKKILENEEEFLTKLQKLYWYTFDNQEEDEKITQEQHPTLFRDLGYKVLQYINENDLEKVPVINDIEFGADSGFCEWVYVINFKTRTFEIYQGLQEEVSDNIFKKYLLEDSNVDGYKNVNLVKVYNFDVLPDMKEFHRWVRNVEY